MLNFESMKHHILAELNDPEEDSRTLAVLVSKNFEINRTTKKICSRPKVKKYRLVFDKRVVLTEDFSSRPYGYEWISESSEL